MEHFQDIFQQAVSIKNSQMHSRRQKFEAQPQFVKAGLYYLNKFESVRAQGFHQRFVVAEFLKQNGNNHFKANELDKAAHEYEQSLSLFRYIKNSNKNWKNEGILDDELEYIEETGVSLIESQKIQALKVAIYINLALTYLKLKKFNFAIKASDEALRLDPTNTKALFRRAKAKITDINAGIGEHVEALKDLELAAKHDPEDPVIREEMGRVVEEIKRLKQLEKKNSFSGIFNKPQPATSGKALVSSVENKKKEEVSKSPDLNSVNKKNENEGVNRQGEEKEEKKDNNNLQNMKYNLSYEVDPSAKIPNEINELGSFLNNKGPQIVKLYEATGKVKEAEELKEKLKTALAAKDQLEKIASLDFNKPTPHLKEMAEKLNIDLFDPSIKNELMKVQAQNIIDLRRWLDEVNKNPEKMAKNPINAKKPEVTDQEIFKTSTTQTQIGNNYYINNNFYSSNAINSNNNTNNNNNDNMGNNELTEKGDKKGICKKCEKDLHQQDSNKFVKIMNYFIAILAIVLVLLTLILHYFSD